MGPGDNILSLKRKGRRKTAFSVLQLPNQHPHVKDVGNQVPSAFFLHKEKDPSTEGWLPSNKNEVPVVASVVHFS